MEVNTVLKIKHKKSGLTLIEVLISLLILEIVLTPILSMVLTTVKTNKNAEDKQQAQYIAQQYIEQLKSESKITVGTYPTINNNGFQVNEIITSVDNYDFPPARSSTSDSIAYDAKIVIRQGETGQIADIYDYTASIPQYSVSLTQGTNNFIITNGINQDGVINPSVININLNGTSYPINKSTSKQYPNSGEVLFQFNSDASVNIDIQGINNCSSDTNNSNNDALTFYMAQEEGQNVTYTLENEKGKIQTYPDIVVSNSSYSNSSRVYRIDVEVLKDGQSIQKMTAYKSVAQ